MIRPNIRYPAKQLSVASLKNTYKKSIQITLIYIKLKNLILKYMKDIIKYMFTLSVNLEAAHKMLNTKFGKKYYLLHKYVL